MIACESQVASGRSKGVRLVSANTEIKKMINNGNRGIKNHTLCWLSMMLEKWKVPVSRITASTAELRISS